MKRGKGDKPNNALNMRAENKKICLCIDGCKVKLNFPPVSEETAMKEIKRMMLNGAVKP